jgi:hypothetical protein
MNTDDNKQITTEKYLSFLKQQKDFLESQMAARFGMKLYKSADGFTQEEIYEYAGAKDCVTTLTLRQEAAKVYGESLTVVFFYYQKDRITLEKDKTALNDISNVKVKELLGELDESLQAQLLKDGIPTKDIVEMLVGPAEDENNTYASSLLRKPKVLEIPFEGKGNGDDIFLMYGALCHFIANGIELTPEEHNKYLAYKIVLEREKLTEKEKVEIFDENGTIINQEVYYFLLLWKKGTDKLTEKNEADLKQLSQNRIENRLGLADKELQNMGLSFEKLVKKYPEKAVLLFLRILDFYEHRYNIVGKHLLYMSFESFLHIYLRHVKELAVENQFGERSKFQLAEKDLKATMNIVLGDLNDEYQTYKDKYPNNRFFRKGNMAHYYNGDYYDVDILPDGQIGSFYKRIDK